MSAHTPGPWEVIKHRHIDDESSAISSPGSEGGAMPFGSLDGPMIDTSGQALAPVSPSRAPAPKLGAMIRATFGLRGFGSSESAALSRSLANRLKARLTTDGSILFSMTWSEKVTPQGRRVCRLQASGRSTSDSASGSWPTPQAGTPGTEQYNAAGSTDYERKVDVLMGTRETVNGQKGAWPTPCAQMANGEPEAFLERKRRAVARGVSMGVALTDLNMVAKLATWATPTSRDHKDGSSVGSAPINALLGRQAWLSGSSAATASAGQLNPAHSRWLMGYPRGWDACAVTAMPSSRKSRRNSSAPTSKQKGSVRNA